MMIDMNTLKNVAKKVWEFNELIAVISYDGKKLLRELKSLKNAVVPEKKNEVKVLPPQDHTNE